MKTKKWSAFLAIAVLTLGMGLFISPPPAWAKPHWGFNNSNNYWKYNFWEDNSSNGNNNGGTDKPVASVPEPSTILLLGSGMAGLAIMHGRKRWKK